MKSNEGAGSADCLKDPKSWAMKRRCGVERGWLLDLIHEGNRGLITATQTLRESSVDTSRLTPRPRCTGRFRRPCHHLREDMVPRHPGSVETITIDHAEKPSSN